jgi:hypothetical protein
MASGKRIREDGDPRSVIVESDQARPHVMNFIAYLDEVVADRDAARKEITAFEEKMNEKGYEIAELNEKLGFELDKNSELEKDAEYWKSAEAKSKTAAEDFEMDNRKLVDENTKLKSSAVKYKEQIEKMGKLLKSKDILLSNINHVSQENENLKNRYAGAVHEVNEKLQIIAEMNASLVNQSGFIDTQKQQTDKTIADLIDGVKKRDAATEKLSLEISQLKLQHAELDKTTKAVKKLFTDAHTNKVTGTPYLLESGEILSLQSIATSWISDDNGMGNFLVRCNDIMTKVVHCPAVCGFYGRLATSASLDTVPPFYFRFSEKKTKVNWTLYNAHDQLLLIAKMIGMFKSTNRDSNFQIMIMENHVVTATCIKDLAAKTANISISLNVVTGIGGANPHRIEFVDGSPTLFPSAFKITLV